MSSDPQIASSAVDMVLSFDVLFVPCFDAFGSPKDATLMSFDMDLSIGSGALGAPGTPTPTLFDIGFSLIAVIYSFAISFISLVAFWSYIILGRGSSPLAFALVARVFFFCL